MQQTQRSLNIEDCHCFYRPIVSPKRMTSSKTRDSQRYRSLTGEENSHVMRVVNRALQTSMHWRPTDDRISILVVDIVWIQAIQLTSFIICDEQGSIWPRCRRTLFKVNNLFLRNLTCNPWLQHIKTWSIHCNNIIK